MYFPFGRKFNMVLKDSETVNLTEQYLIMM